MADGALRSALIWWLLAGFAALGSRHGAGCWRWAYCTGAGPSVWLGLALHPGYSAIGCLLRWAFSRRWALDAVFCALGEAWLWPCAGLHPSAGNDGLLALGSRLGAIVAGLTATVLGILRLGSGWRLALDVGSPGLWLGVS